MFNVDTILNICNGKLIYGCKDITCDTFSNDTRTINKGDTYIGIKGENFDGNTFYKTSDTLHSSVSRFHPGRRRIQSRTLYHRILNGLLRYSADFPDQKAPLSFHYRLHL